MKKRLITGGCGFIGSNFLEYLQEKYPEDQLVNLDALTYAGKPENVAGLKKKNYVFVKGNICDQDLVESLFKKYDFDEVVNFAAESHVDNSILGPRIFVKTNVDGTLNLIDVTMNAWKQPDGSFPKNKRFLQISTDEVYGSTDGKPFTEESPIRPSSPYSSAKASADLIVHSFFVTFGMPVLISRCSNNYGPRQDREKLLPLMITNALKNKKLPVYGDGLNVRDWLYVKDHCTAIDLILEKGRLGEVYNIGGSNEWKNLDIVKELLRILGKPESLIKFVKDRPGHDRRYAIDSSKLQKELGWKPQADFKTHLKETVAWFQKKIS